MDISSLANVTPDVGQAISKFCRVIVDVNVVLAGKFFYPRLRGAFCFVTKYCSERSVPSGDVDRGVVGMYDDG